MVVKIQKSYPSVKGTLDYNFRKVLRGLAEVIGFSGLTDDSKKTAEKIFGIYENRNIRTDNVSFQISINPNPNGPSERLTDEEACTLAQELMAGLGYGEQPFLVFRHEDIERTHYHVVSIRVNEKGRKINDSNEKRKLQKLMKKLSKKYHFTIGNDDTAKTEKKRRKTDAGPDPVPQIPDKVTEIRQEILNRFDLALQYRVQTPKQFAAVAESLGLLVSDLSNGRNSAPCLSLQLADGSGAKTSAPITETELGSDLSRKLAQHLGRCRQMQTDSLIDRKRIADTIRRRLAEARDLDDLLARLRKDGITLHFSRTADGEIFGTTIVDHKGKTAYKASEIDRSLSAKIFKELESGTATNRNRKPNQSLDTARRQTEATGSRNRNQDTQDTQEAQEKKNTGTDYGTSYDNGHSSDRSGEGAADVFDLVDEAAKDLERTGNANVRDKVAEDIEKDGKKKPRKPKYI